MIGRLTREHEPALEELLAADPLVNLFLLGFLAVHPTDRAWWYGVLDADRVSGAVLVLPGHLCVPWTPDPTDAAALGRHLAGLHRPCMTVGPREDVDQLWGAWGPGVAVRRWYDQRLYVLSQPPPGPSPSGLRRATLDEWRTVAAHAGAMEEEDLGRNPYTEDADTHERAVQDRVRAGRTWVLDDDDGTIVFQVSVGTTTAAGCQIGGTYVPVDKRGRGWAKRGIAALGHRLLTTPPPAACPVVTLHVNEANEPAVRTYEAAGFERHAPFRLITL